MDLQILVLFSLLIAVVGGLCRSRRAVPYRLWAGRGRLPLACVSALACVCHSALQEKRTVCLVMNEAC